MPNLLSVSKLIEKGNGVEFDKQGCKVFNGKGTLVAVGDLINSVYKLRIDNVQKCLWSTSDKVSRETWRRRFGNLNYKDLCKMQKGAVEGMSFKRESERGVCVTCCEGKQTRGPLKRQGNRATFLLQLIHTDVCGPREHKSILSSKYLVDDYSKMTFAYF